MESQEVRTERPRAQAGTSGRGDAALGGAGGRAYLLFFEPPRGTAPLEPSDSTMPEKR